MHKHQESRLDLVYLFLAMPWNYFCVVFVINPLFWPGNEVRLVPSSPWMLLFWVVILLFLGDFLLYWFHRISHQWLPLWRLHAVHHSTEHVLSISTTRIHPLSDLLSRFCLALPAVFLPIDATTAGVAGLVFLGQQFLAHSTIRLPNWVSWVFITPQLHRWHHRLDDSREDYNFAFMFSFIDRIFGTYHNATSDPKRFGLPRPEAERVGSTFLRQMVSPVINHPRNSNKAT